jgi:hypothetical protein
VVCKVTNLHGCAHVGRTKDLTAFHSLVAHLGLCPFVLPEIRMKIVMLKLRFRSHESSSKLYLNHRQAFGLTGH